MIPTTVSQTIQSGNRVVRPTDVEEHDADRLVIKSSYSQSHVEAFCSSPFRGCTKISPSELNGAKQAQKGTDANLVTSVALINSTRNWFDFWTYDEKPLYIKGNPEGRNEVIAINEKQNIDNARDEAQETQGVDKVFSSKDNSSTEVLSLDGSKISGVFSSTTGAAHHLSSLVYEDADEENTLITSYTGGSPYSKPTKDLLEENKEQVSSPAQNQLRDSLEEDQFKYTEETESARKEHMINLKSAIDLHGRYNVNVASVFVRVADFYFSLPNYSQALLLQKEALTIYRTKLGDFDPLSIDTKVKIGDILMLQNKLEEALEFFCQTLNMRLALQGELHPSIPELRMRIADILRKKGLPKEAIKEVKRALKVLRETHRDDHPMIANRVEEIVSLYAEMGDHDKVNHILREIVHLKVAKYGRDHPDVADALMNWAWSFDAIGNFAKAIKVMKQAYVINVKNEGEFGLSTAKVLDSIGKLYARAGQNDKAIKAFTRVLTIKKATCGENSTDTAASYVVVGMALRQIGEAERAMKCMSRAIAIYNNCNDNEGYGDELLDSLHQIGLSFEVLGDYDEALKAFSHELTLREGKRDPDLGRIARNLNAVGVVHCRKSEFDTALRYFIKALSLYQASSGRNSSFADTLFNAGLAHEKLGKHKDACISYTEAIIIYEADGVDEQHPNVVKSMEKLRKIGTEQIFLDHLVRTHGNQLSCTLLDKDTTVHY